jgi:hypothetical protein
LSDLAGRGQLKWGSVENLQSMIDRYFAECEQSNDVPTMQGLAVALKVSPSTVKYYANGHYEARLSKKALEAKEQLLLEAGSEEDYIKDNEENGIYCKDTLTESYDAVDSIKAQVSTTLKMAKAQMEAWLHRAGFQAKNPAYHIFYGKSAYGYTDQPQDVNLHQNNIQLNIKLDTTGAQKLQNQPTIIVSANPVDD